MESLFLLIPVALVFVVIAIKVLFWAVNSGQYDDLNTEGYRILFDDDEPKASSETEKTSGEAGDDAGDEADIGEKDCA